VFDALARLADRRHRLVLTLAAAFVLFAAAFGGPVVTLLDSDDDFEDHGSESVLARGEIEQASGHSASPDMVVLVRLGAPVSSQAAQAKIARVARALEDPGVAAVAAARDGRPEELVSRDGRSTYLLATFKSGVDDDKLAETLQDRVEQEPGVSAGGGQLAFAQVSEQVQEDLARAEMLAFPLLFLLSLVVFRSVVAALLPIVVGATTILTTFVWLRLVNTAEPMSVFAINLITGAGLGLAIDYSLFVVSRYREELHAGHEPQVAVVRTVRTAGRTVAFSAVTVAASLCALLVFPLAFLRSFAYAGVAVAFLAGAFSVVVLPAILVMLGRNVDRLTIFKRSTQINEEGFWHRMALFVMRRPVAIAAASIAVLLFLGAPFLGIKLSLPDDRVLPEEAQSRQVTDVLREEFPSGEAGATSVVAEGIGDPAERTVDIDAYAVALAQLPGVSRVDAVTGSYCGEGLADLGCQPGQLVLAGGEGRYLAFSTSAAGGSTYLSVVPDVEPLSPQGEALVADIRTTNAPFDVQVTGQSARLVDVKEELFAKLPLAAAIIAIVTFLVLFIQFGSVVIPIKAIILNLLSLSATFGAMVWVFQQGNLSGPLNFTATGTLDATTPILMFCVAFGLSMDYEVFLLSRIKEEYDRTGDNELSVARGLERTGRIVTAASMLIAVVFLSFATSHITFIKLFGIGLTLAVLMDAFLIRGTLVPAFMRLAGEWNWWAPRPLRWVHARIGISEHVDLDDEPKARRELAEPLVTALPGYPPRPRRTTPLVATTAGQGEEPDDA
jgi:putative drug exporter of the RND superfamily